MIVASPDRDFSVARRYARLALALVFVGALCAAEPAWTASHGNAGNPETSPPVRLAQGASPEVVFWESVRDSENPAEIEAYLKAYPNGQFAPLARIRLDKLKRSTPEEAPAKSPATPKSEEAKGAPPTKTGILTLSAKLGERAGSNRGFLGVKFADITDELAKSLGLPNAKGALVTEVLRNSAAELAGVKDLDVIVAFDGRTVPTWRSLLMIISPTPPGSNVTVDVRRFVKSFSALADQLRARAEKDDAGAAYGLGWLYANGAGTAIDNAKAVEWYRKAAEWGHAEAMFRLGAMYAGGLGVSKDDTKAVDWYRKGADKNDPMAIAQLGWMNEMGLGVTKNEAEAARLYRKAAEMGNSAAMFWLGNMYYYGHGVPQDDAEAVIWFRKGAEDDNSGAIANLGILYEQGRGVFKDDAQAVRLYRKAAELNHPVAMYWLANMYANGHGVAKDDVAAVNWYRQSAELGNSRAMTALGWM